MPYKFERLEVWKLSMDYLDLVYAIADKLLRSEDFNLKSQIIRAATSNQLNIAEGSTSQTDAEQSRFIGLAIRFPVEGGVFSQLFASHPVPDRHRGHCL